MDTPRASSSKQATTKAAEQQELERIIKGLSAYLPAGPTLDFILCQIRVSRKKNKGQRWTAKDKSLALSLYHSSPKTYRLLQKIFRLPSVRTLYRIMQNICIYPGFNEQIIEALQRKVVNMASECKLCMIAMDEISIKESLIYNVEKDEIEGYEDFGSLGRTKYVANHAIAFLVRGLTTKWKQPVGYFLSSGPISGETLKNVLFECIEKLVNIGLSVKLVVCDQGSNNRRLFETLLGATIEKPYFMATEKKIFVLYDPPHLVKSIRNNLKKHGFKVNEVKILWQYIREFYELDSTLQIRMAPRLTARHINLPPFAPLRVNLATQVLSHSVAAGISTLSSLGKLPPEAMDTAVFLERLDMLFNCFNSATLSSTSKMRHALAETSGHKQFLLECLEWFSSVASLSTRQPPCLAGWKMAINVLLQLWDDLHTNHGLAFLLTNRLNQDCVENLFSIIRGKGGHRDNPDPCQFRQAFRQVMVDAILLPSPKANCEEDVDSFLLTMKSLSHIEEAPAVPVVAPVQDANSDLPELVRNVLSVMSLPMSGTLSVEESNIVAYIAGHICRKIRNKVCSVCREQLCTDLDMSNDAHIFLSKKNYTDSKEGLLVPSAAVLTVVEQMETEFRQLIASVVHMSKVRYRIACTLSKKMGDSMDCVNCHRKSLVVNIFVNIRLHHCLRENNRCFISGTGRKNRKVMKFSHE